MRKILLDCGAYTGDSIRNLSRGGIISGDFLIYCFEPNIALAYKILEKSKPNIFVSNKAVWIKNEQADFYLDVGGRCPMGSTLFLDKDTRTVDKKSPSKVSCIDFSQWVIDTFSINDYIVLKIDIEGAEYRVLDKMIEDGSIEYIDYLVAEFHYDRIGSISKNEHDRLIEKIKEYFNIEIFENYNMKAIKK